MTRDHAAIQLLRHGELRYRDFLAITRWPGTSADRVLAKLCEDKRIRRVRRGIYQLTEAA